MAAGVGQQYGLIVLRRSLELRLSHQRMEVVCVNSIVGYWDASWQNYTGQRRKSSRSWR